MDILKMILEAVAGLVLFLYGVSKLSDTLQKVAGDRMKQILTNSTKNRAFPGCFPFRGRTSSRIN